MEALMAIENGFIDNVYFFYTRIQEPTNKWESEEKEWKTTVVVSQADLKDYTKKYPAVKYKMLPNDEFIEKYQMDPPFPDQPIQYILNFKQNVLKADGTPIAESMIPKVILEDAAGTVYDVTNKYLVGNGSKGKVFYVAFDTKYGKFPKLHYIVVNKLVKFERDNGFNALAAAKELTDDIDLSSVIVDNASSTETSAPAAPAAKTSPVPKDDTLPF